MSKRVWMRTATGAAALLLLAQAVPYGRDHTNPPGRTEPRWSSPEVRDLAKRACFDCHSNETQWPWYTHVAPASWLVQRDVDEGRRKLNFQEWQTPQKEAHEAAEEVQEGEMPMKIYLPLHPQARLTPEEKAKLVAGLKATLGAEGKGEAGKHGEGREDRD